MAIGVVRPESTEVEGFGVVSLENPLPVTPQTVFQVASVSKTFTAALTMQLIDEGRFGLNDPIAKVWPECPRKDGVTIEHLLTHRSGWDGDVTLFDAVLVAQARRRLEDIADVVAEVPALAPPGLVTSYNNLGFNVLGRIAEHVTGETFDSLLKARFVNPAVLGPFGLTADAVMGDRVAQPHGAGPGGSVVLLRNANVGGVWASPPINGPMGGVIVSMHGLMRWAEVLLGRRPDVLKTALAESMRVRRVPFFGMGDAIGLGLMLKQVGPNLSVEHGGNLPGYQTTFVTLPEHNMAFGICTNAQAGATLIRDVRRIMFRELLGIDEPAVSIDEAIVVDPAHVSGAFDHPWALTVHVSSAAAGSIEIRFDDASGGTRKGPVPPTMTAGPSGLDQFVVTAPEPVAGTRFDFIRDRGEVRWLRIFGRIAPRSA